MRWVSLHYLLPMLVTPARYNRAQPSLLNALFKKKSRFIKYFTLNFILRITHLFYLFLLVWGYSFRFLLKFVSHSILCKTMQTLTCHISIRKIHFLKVLPTVRLKLIKGYTFSSLFSLCCSSLVLSFKCTSSYVRVTFNSSVFAFCQLWISTFKNSLLFILIICRSVFQR